MRKMPELTNSNEKIYALVKQSFKHYLVTHCDRKMIAFYLALVKVDMFSHVAEVPISHFSQSENSKVNLTGDWCTL